MNEHVRITRHNLAEVFGLRDNTDSPESRWREGRMYAISFDLDTDALARHYRGSNPKYGYEEIRRVLAKHGFSWQQGSVYFGDKHVTPVTCVVAVQAVQQQYSWFAKVVRDIRMLRIEENNDLLPAIGELDLFEGEAPTAAPAK